MSNSNNLFEMLFKIALKGIFNPPSSSNPKDNRGENELMLALLGLLAFVGADAVKVVFRKNFGIKGLNLIKVVLASIAFGAISYFAFHFSQVDTEINLDYGSHKSYHLAGVFYAILSLYVLVTGIYHKARAAKLNFHPEYRGDSFLLASLIEKNGWKQSTVQNWIEPLIVVTLGGLISISNLLWGLPIVFCGLSVWGHQFIEYLFGHNPVNTKMQDHGYKAEKDDYTQVK